MKYCCTLPICTRSFDTKKGLYWHEIKDPIHNPNRTYVSEKSSGLSNSGNKNKNRSYNYEIPYEGGNSEIVDGLHKKKSKGPKCIDVDILSSMLIEETPKFFVDEESDAENYDNERTNIDEEVSKMDISESLNNFNPDLLKIYNLEYIKYQYKLYDEIFGRNAIESENLEQFKDTMEKFEVKRLSILRIYLLAKSCNMSRKMETIY